MLIVTGWLIWTSINAPEPPKPNRQDTTQQTQQITKETQSDTAAEQDQTGQPQELKSIDTVAAGADRDSVNRIEKFGEYFAPLAKGSREVITVENELLEARISSKGADIINWKLKKYNKWDGVPTQLIREHEGQLYIDFWTIGNRKVNTRDLYFEFDGDKNRYGVTGDNKLTITARLKVAQGRQIVKRFTFYGDKYTVDTDIKLVNMGSLVPRGYNFAWSGGLAYQEKNSEDESQTAKALVSMNNNLEEINATGDEPEKSSPEGMVDYAAIKIKYFTAAIIPLPKRQFDGIVDLYGEQKHIRKADPLKDATVEIYDMSIRVPYNGGVQTDSFRVYIGPLDYDIVNKYGMASLIDLGWKFLIRPIGEFFMLPIFNFIHKFVPNYGIAIIIFSLLMKILLYPLSIKQMQSAQKMKLLGPEMQKIRDKYKDDNQKIQRETMNLYSQYGVNPAGGCLPLLLQLPILYAMWQILRTTIELRQADFFLWITDLSTPDVILNLGFKLPIIGLSHFSGLAVLMGITMFVQQKLTITDPRQKAMVYMMPVMFTLIFSNFPSGLNLYYFFFNLWSILQQVYISNFSKNRITLEDMKKQPKKEGWFQKKMREAQDIAQAQGKNVPGGKYGKPADNKPEQQQQLKKKQPQKRSSPTQGGKKKK